MFSRLEHSSFGQLLTHAHTHTHTHTHNFATESFVPMYTPFTDEGGCIVAKTSKLLYNRGLVRTKGS